MLTAIAVALQYIEFSIPIVPSFLKLDLSDLPELIGTFVLGPWWAVAICFLKNLIHMPAGTSGGVGELSNFMLGAVFVITAGLIYQRKKTRKTALLACLLGALAMAAASFPTNYFIVYPVYTVILPMDAIVGMYKAILPSVDGLLECLVIFNMPFTFAKGAIAAVISIPLFKRLKPVFTSLGRD